MRQVKQEDNHLKVEYSAPLMGIDTSAPAPYINGLADANNFLIRSNTWIPTTWQPATFGDQNTFPATSLLLGFGELPFPSTNGGGAVDVGDKFFYIAQDTGSNISGHIANTLADPSTNIGSVASLGGIVTAPITWKSINNSTYLSAKGMCQILQISTSAGVTTLTELTNQLGCQFLGEFNGRLIALNIYQFQAGTPAVINNFPFQIAWSAGGQQYSVWNVLDGSGNPTGAGFNNLPDVEDAITGALFIGPTVYIIRRKGMTEMTALSSGIQPFNFDHMWASHNGVGTVYPDSIAQYGPKGAFVADDDIYSIGLEGISVIGGAAKSGIYSDLLASNFNIQATMCALMINGEPSLCYLLSMQLDSNTSTTNYIRTWIYDFSNQQWMKLTLPNGINGVQATQTLIDVVSLLLSNIIVATEPDDISPSSVLLALQGVNAVPKFYYIPINPFTGEDLGSSNQSFLKFPAERLQTFKDVTIDAIGFYVTGTDGSSFKPIVDGIEFTLQVIGTGRDSAKNLYMAYPTSQVALTTLQPQLTVEASGYLAFGEISLYGTIGPGRRP